MFDDVIELLLGKKSTLREELEREFAKRAEKIDNLLDACGYVKPKVEDELPEEVSHAGEAVEETTNY